MEGNIRRRRRRRRRLSSSNFIGGELSPLLHQKTIQCDSYKSFWAQSRQNYIGKLF